MKKFFITTTVLLTFALSGCSTTGSTINKDDAIGTASNIGSNLFKAAVDSKCRSELEQQSMWRISRAAMSVEQEAAMQDKICGCVSEQAPQQVTVVDMTNAAVDSAYRAQLVTKVVAKSLQTCYAQIVQ